MSRLIDGVDWSSTPIGPRESWSPALRMMVRVLLANRFPMLLWWGPEYVGIYNDAYRPVLGTKHPWALGRPVRECWSEIWHILQPLIDTPFFGGPATWNDDIQLELNRYGYAEETHFTIAYSPVPDETAPNGIGGVLATVTEITEKVVGERRIAALRDLGARTADVTSAADACAHAAQALARHDKDVPFALFYLLNADRTEAALAAAVGVAPGEAISPRAVDLTRRDLRAWPLADAARTDAIQLVSPLADWFDWIPAGPWADPPVTAVVASIPSTRRGHPVGVMVTGVSARLRFDAAYRDFVELARTQVGTAVTNALAYDEERRRAAELTELDRAKTAFFSNVSHEFRTPLTLMLGPLEAQLANDDDTLAAGVRHDLEIVHRNGLRLLRLVNGLLDFSRIEAGRVQASYVATDLAALTTDLASGFRSATDRAGLILTVDCPPLTEPVFLDRGMWEKIVLNLLSNAFKFTFEGRIGVTVRAAGGAAELRVADTGTGIPAEALPRLFERFYRVDGARGRTYEGSGIGLALVRELVSLHGGTVDVASELGRGTTFTIRVPFGTAHLPADRVLAAVDARAAAPDTAPFVQEALRWLPDPPDSRVADRGASAQAPHRPVAPAPAAGRPQVLVADDNADMRQYIAGLLAASYEVTVVNDGRAAWHAIQTTAPDLILCDVMMPHMDGFALLRAVRGDTAVRAIPVVLLSARAGEESRVEGLERGADDYLIKPFSARELLARVGAHIEISRVRRETEEALRLADRRKDEFLAMLAHELRNPLAPIRTGLELLRRSGDTPEGVARVRQMMERQVAHIVRLLDDLLDVSRITSGKIHLQREPMAVALGIHSAVEANRSAIAAKEIDLVVSLPPYPCVVDVDPTRFVQILSNLLHNATKFTERGGVIRVSVEVADTGAVPHVEVVVADSGIGISADLLPRVFDLFTQGDAPAPQPGLGIGLALAKRLVDMHGGTLVVKSDGRGKGSEFIVRMPCATSAFDGERPGHVVETQLDCRVLVIDDNRDAADVTALLVQSLGGDARVAYDGPTGLASALEFRPDLVLVDIRMPGLDGYEVCRRIRHVLGDGVALVALTGFGQASDRQEALRAGFDAHLTKPADPGVLATLVARYRRGDTREQTELRT